MSRNMINTNKQAFENIISQIERCEYDIPYDTHKSRYINTNDTEKELLKKLKIEKKEQLTFDLSAVIFSYNENKYFCIFGKEISVDKVSIELLTKIELNAGFFTILLAETDIPLLKNDINNFINDIMGQVDISGYKGNSYDEMIKYFAPVILFEIPQNSIFYNADIYRISTYVISSGKDNVFLDFSNHIIKKINELTLEIDNPISFENILNSIISVNYHHSFLELYRNIERLYSISYLNDLYDELSIDISYLEFASKLENSTSWKPKESEAIKKLFSSIPENTITIPDEYSDNFDNFIYKLRNSIVHFRPTNEKISLKEEKWNEIINSCLLIIEHFYNKYKKQLTSAQQRL